MAKKKSQRPNRPQSTPPSRQQDAWWKRPASWCFGLANGFVAAFAAALAGVLAVGTPAWMHAITGNKASATPSGSPVKIEQVMPFVTGPDTSFVVPGSLQLSSSQLHNLSSENPNDLAKFEEAHHGVGIGTGSTSVTVEGNSTGTVTITGLQVVKHCTSPLTGTYFYNPSGGDDTTISLGFNLDSQVDYAQDTKSESENIGNSGRVYSGNFFLEHVVTLAPGEPQTFVIYASTAKQYCQFSFQLTVATPEGTVTENIPTDGKEFALTGIAGPVPGKSGGIIDLSAYSRAYIGGVADPRGQWVEVNPKAYNGIGDPASFPPSR